jgi:insertion element IS1 protein InsB
MALNIENNYNISTLCTDGYPVYAKFKIANRHLVTKAETSLVESKNALIRHYLARFNRRTIRYSKAIDMIENSLLLLFSKRNELMSIVI